MISSMGPPGIMGATNFSLDFTVGLGGLGPISKFTPILKPGYWDLSVSSESYSGPALYDGMAWIEAHWAGGVFTNYVFFFPCGPPPDGPFEPLFFINGAGTSDPDCEDRVYHDYLGPGTLCACGDQYLIEFQFIRLSIGYTLTFTLNGTWVHD